MIFKKPIIFEWDEGNFKKNWDNHKVTNTECEEAFFDEANIGYEAPTSLRSGYLLPTLRRERNPSEAKSSSLSSSILRSRYFAKGDKDEKHSKSEERFVILAKTKRDRKLQISYTIRRNMIRVISARDQSKKERKYYAN